MRILLQHLSRLFILWLIGGFAYVGLEISCRGKSHWSMFVVGGLCFVCIGLLNEVMTWKMSIIGQMFLSACIVTLFEFTSGCIVNLLCGWNVWDYSNMPYNILGQVCLLFTNIWFVISLIGIVLDDYLRHILFGEEFHKYKIF